MAHIIKKGPIKVPTQPKDFDLQATGLVFKSYDNQIALEFNVAQQDGTPADLLGANLRLLMFIYDEVDGTIKKEPIPFITKNLITESFLNGHVVYILPEAMKAYNGMVEAYVYIEYPDGSTSDNLGFTFRMKRSAIDGLAQDKADYFIEDFKQLLAAASLEANKVIEGLDTEIKNLQQATKDANTAVDGAMGRIDGLEAEIGQLERLREMYIDTLDFGDYDYSGNPNLMCVIKASDFKKQGDSDVLISDVEYNSIRLTSQTVNHLWVYSETNIPSLVSGKTYTMSAKVKIEEGTTGNIDQITVSYRKSNGGTTLLAATGEGIVAGKEIIIKGTSTVNYEITDLSRFYLDVEVGGDINGSVIVSDIKIEEGSTVTPYQPNLLLEPYNMCRGYPNENIASKSVKFPFTTSNYPIYGASNTENYKVGQTYTLTMKATKPATQTFSAFIKGGTLGVGVMNPVEGLTDVWRVTFKVTQSHIDSGVTNNLSIYQLPQDTIGSVAVDWIKLEKGEVSTPLETPTYKGLGILDTNDPTKYVWNYTELVDVDGIQDALENVEQRTVTLEGKANTIDGRLNNVNTALNTVQSTADQILSEVTAANVMKKTDLPSYLANKPIVAGGMADFAGKVAQKVHPNPHKCANYAIAYEDANQAPSKCFAYECSQASYDKFKALDGNVDGAATNTVGQTGTTAFKFDLISQITKDFPSFFDDCPTQETKVTKIQKHIISTTLTLNAKTTNTSLYVAAALNDGWSAEGEYVATSQITEQKYAVLNNNSTTRSYIQNDGSIIFRARTRAVQESETNVTVKQEVDYVRLDYTLNLSSDDFLTPIERDVTKDNLTQILSDDSVTIKGVMDFKGKVRENNTNCPHVAYIKDIAPQVTNMSEITYEADVYTYDKIQNKDDGLVYFLAPESETGRVGQAKFKFDLVTAIEKEHPHLFKGLTTTKQKVDVLKAKMQELKFNVWARGEGTNGNIQIGSSLSNADAIDTRETKDIGETAEFARAEFYSNNNDTCARRINDDGTVLYWLCGSAVSDSLPQPKVVIDYVNLEYTLSDKPSDYVVSQTDATYLAAVVKTKELDRYKEYFDKGKSFGADTAKLTTITPGASLGVHGTRAVTISNGVFTATKPCKLLFDFSVKMRGNTNTPYNYIFAYKNGLKADEDAVAALGGFGTSDGTATLKFQTNVPLKYIVTMNKEDTLEFKTDFGDSPNKIQEVRMLFGTIEEI